MKNLVIVESPSKSKTIAKYLGKDYTVVSSKGHIRDLAIKGKDGLGVDIENDFAPTYVVSKDKTDTVKDLQKQAKRPTTFIWRPTRTAKGKPSAGTWRKNSVLAQTSWTASRSTRSRETP